jgi:anti-sigma B factor antagonist
MIRKTQNGDVTVFAYTLANVMPTSPESIALPLDKSMTRIVIDLAGVGYISSNVLGAWVACHKHLEEVGGKMALCNAVPAIREILEITKLEQLFPIFATQAEAIAAVSA